MTSKENSLDATELQPKKSVGKVDRRAIGVQDSGTMGPLAAAGAHPDWDGPVAEFLATLVAAGHTKPTVRLRADQLRNMAVLLACPLAEVTERRLTAVFSAQPWQTETRRSYRAAARRFFAWCYGAKIIFEDPACRLPVIKMPRPVPRPAPDPAWADAVGGADGRLSLMLRLAAEAGLRRGEVARVEVEDLIHTPGGPVLLVHGKGGRERRVPISDSLAALIELGEAGHTPGGRSRGYVFPGNEEGHLSVNWVGQLCASALPGVWTMHTLRHRFATRAYRGTKNLRAVQELLGHSSPAVTERYVATNDDEMRAAMLAAV